MFLKYSSNFSDVERKISRINARVISQALPNALNRVGDAALAQVVETLQTESGIAHRRDVSRHVTARRAKANENSYAIIVRSSRTDNTVPRNTSSSGTTNGTSLAEQLIKGGSEKAIRRVMNDRLAEYLRPQVGTAITGTSRHLETD